MTVWPDSRYAAKNSSGSVTRYTLFHPPPECGLKYAGKPTYEKISSHSRGKTRLDIDSPVVSGGCWLDGSSTVFGTATPTLSATTLLKNLSSADHQKGSFTTIVPSKASFFRTAR